MSCAKKMKYNDLEQYSTIFAAEFNNERIHDRVLVFEVNDDEYFPGYQAEEKEAIKQEDVTSSTTANMQEKLSTNNGYESLQAVINSEKDICTINGIEGGTVIMLTDEKEDKEERADVVNIASDNKLKKEENLKTNGVDGEEYFKYDDIGSLYSDNQDSDHDELNRRKLYVHSSWLSVQSSYFRALFYSGMHESFSKEVVMKVAKQELEAHLTLIEAMYNINVLDGKEYHHVVDVLLLADKYDVKLVFKKCKYSIISTPWTMEKAELILKTAAQMSDCSDINDAVCDFLVGEFSPLETTCKKLEFYSLSKASLCVLLGSNKLVVRSENTVFLALLQWVEQHVLVNFEHVRSLLSLVRFKLMSFDFLNDFVRHNALAQRMDGFHAHLIDAFAYLGSSRSRREHLKDKPAPRRSNVNADFSWEIDQVGKKKLLAEKALCSKPFVIKGYKFFLQLHYNDNVFGLFLFVRNLKAGKHISISWSASSILFRKIYLLCPKGLYQSDRGTGKRNVQSRFTASILNSQTDSWTIDLWVNFE